jgi:hypothetical protein
MGCASIFMESFCGVGSRAAAMDAMTAAAIALAMGRAVRDGFMVWIPLV